MSQKTEKIIRRLKVSNRKVIGDFIIEISELSFIEKLKFCYKIMRLKK